MYRLLLPLAALLLQPLSAQTAKKAAAPESPIKILARADRESAVYHRGETVTFVIKVTDHGKPVESGLVDWSIVKDGLPLERQGRAKIENGQVVVAGKLDEPGFIQVRATYRADEKAKPAAVTGMGGAAIDPTEIKPSLPAPDDFDAFWSAQKQKLAQVPVKFELTSVKSANKAVEAFDLQAPCVGAPVSGYFARPAGAKPKSLPAILTVHGAGVRSSSLGSSLNWASKGFLALDINAHGIPNGKPDEFYTAQAEGPLKDYRYIGRDNPEKCYFTFMFLRLVRALDVLATQPEWDGKILVVSGGSQGGYQAIVAAGLDPRVTFYGAGVPAGCDHTGFQAGRIAGWPKLVPFTDGKPDAAVLSASRYVDCVNFASRTHAAGCIYTVGFIDTVCPPSSCYAAYNQVKVPKQIFHDILSGHATTPAAGAAVTNAILKHAGK